MTIVERKEISIEADLFKEEDKDQGEPFKEDTTLEEDITLEEEDKHHQLPESKSYAL